MERNKKTYLVLAFLITGFLLAGDAYGIEFDFGKKWAEAIGQALYYSSKTGKQPGIVLIISEKNDSNKLEKIKIVARKYGIDIKLWSIRPEALAENK